MLNKIESNKLYGLTDFKKGKYINFQDENIYWDKNKKQLVSSVPNFIVIKDNKEFLSGKNISYLQFGTFQEGLLVDKQDILDISLKEALTYFKLLLNPASLNCYFCKLNSFIKKLEKPKISLERIRK